MVPKRQPAARVTDDVGTIPDGPLSLEERVLRAAARGPVPEELLREVAERVERLRPDELNRLLRLIGEASRRARERRSDGPRQPRPR